MKDYKKFLKEFMDSWKNLEGGVTCELFAEKLNYYENPIDPPLTTKSEVIPLWSVVKENQKDISYKGKFYSKMIKVVFIILQCNAQWLKQIKYKILMAYLK